MAAVDAKIQTVQEIATLVSTKVADRHPMAAGGKAPAVCKPTPRIVPSTPHRTH
jgi:hypothetical protein